MLGNLFHRLTIDGSDVLFITQLTVQETMCVAQLVS